MEIHKLIITPITRYNRGFVRKYPDTNTATMLIKERLEIGYSQKNYKQLSLNTRKILKQLKQFGINIDTLADNK